MSHWIAALVLWVGFAGLVYAVTTAGSSVQKYDPKSISNKVLPLIFVYLLTHTVVISLPLAAWVESSIRAMSL